MYYFRADWKEGYGLKRIKNNPIVAKARSAAEEYFLMHRNMNPPRRACPRAFSQEMVTERNDDGDYKYEVFFIPKKKNLRFLSY